MWWVWVLGVLVIVAAGFAATAVPRLRSARLRRRMAWSAARAAIDIASVSRDASQSRVIEAERLLDQAVNLAAHRGGHRAAEQAERLAGHADRLWRGDARR
ncbi:DUF6403 family protein [Actinoplanes sp. DH11]|uniref:DUF6403 family protein n=1 Tax=Actinoplanes sp. DH11 TaxID=2857011 RepID=UPI001E2D95B3|nr:DUF6403 family protein [Actinoplanes sp. DH11]